jgi:sec-independent protein translocase protein TatA
MGLFRNIGPLEIFLILVAIMIIFGVGKLPSVGRGMGQALREFKSSVKDKDEETTEVTEAKAETKTS